MGGMTDQRQRPQYGEYATPEEQRQAAGLPPVEIIEATPPTADAPAPTMPAAAPSGAAPRPRRADRIITIALLAYGLINVLMTAVSYLDMPAVLERRMAIVGMEGEFTNLAQARLWGTIAAVVLVLGWVATALISVRRLRASKLTWWVPLVGAAVTMFATSLCVMVPMLTDPGFLASLTP